MAQYDALKRFAERAVQAGLPAPSVVSVLNRYREPWRKHHNIDYLQSCAECINDIGLELSDEQTLALLFHKAVYYPGAKGNGEMSAKLFERYAQRMCMLNDAPERTKILWKQRSQIMQIILDTATLEASIPRSRAVIDVTLVSLGQSEGEFDRLVDQLMLEVAGPENAGDAQTRSAFFHDILDRRGGRVYETKPFVHLEFQARENLYRAITEGGGRCPLPRPKG